ncbi:hypothetical protein V6N00_13605 [Tersicoccus sp. MR15.9]|uniref:hypothetical protein n=1 Tax=Tersicoccus mangrovi TaxID=3121635 RepID=UPI002FE53048
MPALTAPVLAPPRAPREDRRRPLAAGLFRFLGEHRLTVTSGIPGCGCRQTWPGPLYAAELAHRQHLADLITDLLYPPTGVFP